MHSLCPAFLHRQIGCFIVSIAYIFILAMFDALLYCDNIFIAFEALVIIL